MAAERRQSLSRKSHTLCRLLLLLLGFSQRLFDTVWFPRRVSHFYASSSTCLKRHTNRSYCGHLCFFSAFLHQQRHCFGSQSRQRCLCFFSSVRNFTLHSWKTKGYYEGIGVSITRDIWKCFSDMRFVSSFTNVHPAGSSNCPFDVLQFVNMGIVW